MANLRLLYRSRSHIRRMQKRYCFTRAQREYSSYKNVNADSTFIIQCVQFYLFLSIVNKFTFICFHVVFQLCFTSPPKKRNISNFKQTEKKKKKNKTKIATICQTCSKYCYSTLRMDDKSIVKYNKFVIKN